MGQTAAGSAAVSVSAERSGTAAPVLPLPPRHIDRARRTIFHIGGYFLYGDIGYVSPLPPSLYGQQLPPPVGYQMGYSTGMWVVYDPVTYFLANLIDLLQ